MSDVTLELEKREILGKAVKNLRHQGFVPGVIHDHGKDSIIVSAEYQALYKVYSEAGKHKPVKLTADGKNYTAIIKTVTFDPRKNSLNHVVFNAVKATQKVTTEIPIHIKLDEGNETTPAERASLLVLHNLSTVEVEAPANKLPDFIEFNGEKLVEVGDHATVADLIVPAGVEIKSDPNQTIASVFEPSAVAAANDAAGGDAEEADTVAAESEGEAGTEEGAQAPEGHPADTKQADAKSE